MKVAVIGGGAWGTALADLLVRKGEQVTLWAREPEVIEGVNRRHANEMFLPGAALAPSLRAEGDIAAAIRGAETIVSAAPSHAVRPVMLQAARTLDAAQPLVVSASKGLDPERLERPSAVLADVLPRGVPVAVLSGPSFAWEVFQRQPTAVVAAATDHRVAQRAQPMTFAGLAGMGDLILTATGALSRNRTLGVALGQGQTLEQALAGKAAVVEGVNTTRTAVALGERHGVELPIAREVANILFENKPARQAIADLMERELKAE